MNPNANRTRWPDIADFVDLLRSVFGEDQVKVLRIIDKSGTYTAHDLVKHQQAIEYPEYITIDELYDLSALGVRAAQRRLMTLRGVWNLPVAVPVTPPLSPMGGTFNSQNRLFRCDLLPPLSVTGDTLTSKTGVPRC